MSSGLESVIGKAVMDPKFREALLDNPQKAIEDAGIDLTKDETKALREGIKELRGNRKIQKTDDVDVIFSAARGGWWT